MLLIDLPTELLDHVFSYLDWDPTESIIPSREDLLNASLVCRHLRSTLEPAIFRNVTLRLCWADGRLMEPSWFRLRKQRPEIAKYTRCVYIHTGIEQCLHCLQRTEMKHFVVPKGFDDWLHLSNDPEVSSTDNARLRPRVNELARKFYQEEAHMKDADSDQAFNAEDLVQLTKAQSRYNAGLDALSIVMLCIPASTTKVIFKAHTQGLHNRDKNVYSHRLLSIVLDLLYDRLQDLTIISNESVRRLGMSRQQLASNEPDIFDHGWIPSDVIQKLAPKRLTFAVNDEYTFGKESTSFVHRGFERWVQLSPSVRELDIRYTQGELQELLQFVKSFDSLQTIRFRDCIINVHSQVPGPQTRAFEQHIWLSFAIEIRKALPSTKIELSNCYRPVLKDKLPKTAVHWILTQAVPEGALIDTEREDRLVEDFISFLPMWWVEDGPRGNQAMEEWKKQRALLSDQAMSRRWR